LGRPKVGRNWKRKVHFNLLGQGGPFFNWKEVGTGPIKVGLGILAS